MSNNLVSRGNVSRFTSVYIISNSVCQIKLFNICNPFHKTCNLVGELNPLFFLYNLIEFV